MMDQPSDVTNLDQHFLIELPLNAQIDRIHDVRPEMWIETFAVGGTQIVAGVGRLREDRRRGRQGSVVAVYADTKSGRGVGLARSAGAIHIGIVAADGLNETDTEQRHQDQIDTVEATVDTAVAGADDCRFGETRIPGDTDARTEFSIERVVRIFLSRSDVTDQRKPKLRVIHLPLKSVGFPLCQIVLGRHGFIGGIHQNG